MLALTWKSTDSLILDMDELADPDMTIRELFSEQPLEIRITRIKKNEVRIAIDAPDEIAVTRKGAE